MAFKSRLLLVTCSMLLLACQSAAQRGAPDATVARAPPATPPILQVPSEGEAILYLFRPELDATHLADRPVLGVDGKDIGAMPAKSYVCVSLKEGLHRITMNPSNGEAQSWSTDLDVTVTAGHTHFVAIWNPDQPQQGSHYAGEPTRVIVLPLVGIAAQGLSLAGTFVAGLTVTALNSLQHRTAPGEKTIAGNAEADIESVPAGQAASLTPTPTAADALPMAYRSNGKNGVTFEAVEADVGAAALGGLMQVHAAGDHPNTQSN